MVREGFGPRALFFGLLTRFSLGFGPVISCANGGWLVVSSFGISASLKSRKHLLAARCPLLGKGAQPDVLGRSRVPKSRGTPRSQSVGCVALWPLTGEEDPATT